MFFPVQALIFLIFLLLLFIMYMFLYFMYIIVYFYTQKKIKQITLITNDLNYILFSFRTTRIWTVAKWDYGSGEEPISGNSFLSLSENVVQGEPWVLHGGFGVPMVQLVTVEIRVVRLGSFSEHVTIHWGDSWDKHMVFPETKRYQYSTMQSVKILYIFWFNRVTAKCKMGAYHATTHHRYRTIHSPNIDVTTRIESSYPAGTRRGQRSVATPGECDLWGTWTAKCARWDGKWSGGSPFCSKSTLVTFCLFAWCLVICSFGVELFIFWGYSYDN